MKKVLSVLLAASMVAVFAACGGAGSNGTSSTSAGSQGESTSTQSVGASGDTIKIGGLAPLTGSASQYGIASSNGSKLAADEINASGGVLGKQIEFVLEDEKGDVTEAVNAYNKLVLNDEIVALVGDITTKPTIAVAQKAAADGIPMITPTATGAVVTEAGENIFRVCFTDPYQGELMAHYAKDEMGAATAAILFDTGDDYSQGIADTFKATAEEIGLTVTANEGYPTDTTDFKAQLTKIKEGNPDVIMIPCYYEAASLIAVQARELGITSKLLGSDGWDGVLNQMDSSNYAALEDVYYCSQYSAVNPTEELDTFLKKYKETYGEEANMFAVLGYEAMKTMASAMEAAGSTDSEAVVAAMDGLEVAGLTGPISYKNGRDPSRDAYIIRFVDGEQDVLGTYSFS